ncbi:class I SAM-dependent methyltransferase [Trichothermofontia sp.]
MWIVNIVRKYLNKFFVPTRADLFALQRLSALNLGFLPTSISAMRPGAINIILNDIIVNERENIVEFGSGISTVYIAALIKQKGSGRLISFEHDQGWIKVVESMLRQNNLSEFVSLEYAPLVSEHPWQSKSRADWYDTDIVYQALKDEKVDLLVVDGPPAYGSEGKRELARLPALLVLGSYLNLSSAVILDDLNRSGEQKIIKCWLEKYKDFNFYDYTLEAGIAYLKRGLGYTIAIQTR